MQIMCFKPTALQRKKVSNIIQIIEQSSLIKRTMSLANNWPYLLHLFYGAFHWSRWNNNQFYGESKQLRRYMRKLMENDSLSSVYFKNFFELKSTNVITFSIVIYHLFNTWPHPLDWKWTTTFIKKCVSMC